MKRSSEVWEESYSINVLFFWRICLSTLPIIRFYCLNGVPFVKIVSGKKAQKKKKKEWVWEEKGAFYWWDGDAGYRSRYLSHAKRALFHLSYTPKQESRSGWQIPLSCHIYTVFIFLTKQHLEFAEIFDIWKFVSVNAG